MEAGKELQTEVWGCGVDIDASDLELPKALVMQKMSKLVDSSGAKPGEIRDSIDGAVLGGMDKPFEAVVFSFDKVWTVTTKEDKKFVRIEPVTPANANDPWEFDEAGKTYLRSQYIRFYCLRAGETPDIPIVLAMGRTSFNAGKRLLTVFSRMKMQGLVSAARVVEFKTVKQEKDGKVYYVLAFEVGRETTPAELAAARGWYQNYTALKHRIKVHEGEEEAPVVSSKPKADEDDILF